MKVCLIAELFYPNLGGGEKYLHDLVLNLSQKDHQIRVLTSYKSGRQEKLNLNSNIEVHYYNWPEIAGHPIPQWRDIANHWSWADVIHTSLYTSALSCAFYNLHLSKKDKRPLALTVFEVIGRDWWLVEKNFFKACGFYLFEKICINMGFSAYLPISLATKNNLVQGLWYRPKLIRTIYPLVSCHTQSRLKKVKSANFYLYYGRPGQTKGVMTLVKAVELLVQTKDDFSHEFHLVLGFKPEKERRQVVNYIESHNLHHLVKVYDPLSESELDHKISLAKAVIIPSLTEGFGYSAFEACQKRKPVIVSAICSLPEVVFGQVIFFQRGNSSDLMRAILDADQKKYKIIAMPKSICDQNCTFNQLTKIYQKII